MNQLLLIIIIVMFSISGCAHYSERGHFEKTEEGKYEKVPDAYIKTRGIGKTKFPDGYEQESKQFQIIPDGVIPRELELKK